MSKRVVYSLMFDGKVVGYRVNLEDIGVVDINKGLLDEYGLAIDSVRGRLKMVEKGNLLIVDGDTTQYPEIEDIDLLVNALRDNFKSGGTRKERDIYDMTVGDFILSPDYGVVKDAGKGVSRIVNKQNKVLVNSESPIDYPQALVKRNYHKKLVLIKLLEGYPIKYDVANNYGNDDEVSRNASAISFFIEDMKYDTVYETGEKVIIYASKQVPRGKKAVVFISELLEVLNSSGNYQYDVAFKLLKKHGVPEMIESYATNIFQLDNVMGKGYAYTHLFVGALKRMRNEGLI